MERKPQDVAMKPAITDLLAPDTLLLAGVSAMSFAGIDSQFLVWRFLLLPIIHVTIIII